MNKSPIQTARRPFSDFGSADLPQARFHETAILAHLNGDDS
jgi:hypothetical protein